MKKFLNNKSMINLIAQINKLLIKMKKYQALIIYLIQKYNKENKMINKMKR